MRPDEFAAEMLRLSHLIDDGINTLRKYSVQAAASEMEYRVAKAQAWVSVSSDLLAAHRLAEVEARTAELRRTRDVDENMRRAAIESIRSRQAQLSALQSLMNAHRAEAEFVRTT
ncbi:MAG: hypothetical protein WC977_07920 [Anaerovoracaceae bacterium]|jgi:hypothetical protein